jgi:hypothetical protein
MADRVEIDDLAEIPASSCVLRGAQRLSTMTDVDDSDVPLPSRAT